MQSKVQIPYISDSAEISPETLAIQLASNDLHLRVEARSRLANLGPVVIPQLRALLSSGGPHTRWEVVKILSEIRVKSSAAALATALHDEDGDVRWSAAEAIIAFGEEAFEPLLQVIMSKSDFVGLRESAAHALAGLKGMPHFDIVAPVLKALRGPAPLFEAPVTAHIALKALMHNHTR